MGAALALAAAISFGAADLAEAKTVQPYAGLTPCAGNKAFEKREKNEIKGLTKRLKQVRLPPACCARVWARAPHTHKQSGECSPGVARPRGGPWHAARVAGRGAWRSGEGGQAANAGDGTRWRM